MTMIDVIYHHLSERQMDERTKLCKSISWTMRDLRRRSQFLLWYFLGIFFSFSGIFHIFFWEIFKTIFDEKVLVERWVLYKTEHLSGLQVTSIHIYYVLYFAFRDIVFSNVVSMGIKNLTLTHASQSCLIQHCKHSHWKYKKIIIIKSSQKLGSCANIVISPYSWG